jgi:hypothetical protein
MITTLATKFFLYKTGLMCPQDTVKKSQQGLTCKKRAHSPDPLSACSPLGSQFGVWPWEGGAGGEGYLIPVKSAPLGTKLIISRIKN